MSAVNPDTIPIIDLTQNEVSSISQSGGQSVGSVVVTKGKKKKVKTCLPEGTCVAGIDIGLKNFSICIMKQGKVDELTEVPQRPTILDWRNSNLYSDRVGGKIIKHEAADRLLQRLEDHLDQVGRKIGSWQCVAQVHIESQAASTSAIRRVESMVFAYFHFKYPDVKVKTISASRKLMVKGMNQHSKEDNLTYKDRKNLAVHYARLYMTEEPEESRFKHFLDPVPRKKKGSSIDPIDPVLDEMQAGKKLDDACDAILSTLYVLGVSIGH